jgi:hypothetical protein
MCYRRWTLDVGRWTLDVGRWTLDAGKICRDAILRVFFSLANLTGLPNFEGYFTPITFHRV